MSSAENKHFKGILVLFIVFFFKFILFLLFSVLFDKIWMWRLAWEDHTDLNITEKHRVGAFRNHCNFSIAPLEQELH